jgi:hypothetical protein
MLTFLIDTSGADSPGVVSPKMVSAMAKVAPALHTVSEKLKTAVVDKDALMLGPDGVTQLTPDAFAAVFAHMLNVSYNLTGFPRLLLIPLAPFQVVDGIIKSVSGLKGLNLMQPQLESAK